MTEGWLGAPDTWMETTNNNSQVEHIEQLTIEIWGIHNLYILLCSKKKQRKHMKLEIRTIEDNWTTDFVDHTN